MNKNEVTITHNMYKNVTELDVERASHDLFLPVNNEAVYNETGLENANQLVSGYKLRSKKNAKTVLEYGCGDGRIARYMANMCKKLICVDISQVVLNRAKQRLDSFSTANAEFILSDSLEDIKAIDFIYCLQVLQHNTFEEQLQIINRIKELLKPNGFACIHFPKLENKPQYVNHDTCMCFTKDQVEHYGKMFSEYEIEERDLVSGIDDYRVVNDYFLWVKK